MLNKPINRWWTVVAGAIGAGLGAGVIMTYAFGIMGKAMIADLGWTRDFVANLMGMFLLGSGVGVVSLGWLIARYGIRGPTAILVLTWGLSLAAVAISPPVPAFFMLLFLVVGFAGAACTAMPYAVAISGFFDTNRGLALGLVVGGSGIGAFMLPPLAQFLVEQFGWRAAFAVTGLGAAMIVTTGLVLLVRTPPGAVVSREDGERRSIVDMCLRSRPFWFIALPIVAISVAAFGMVSSYVFLFADRGIPASTVTAILSFAGFASLVGRLLVGYLLDRIFAPYVTATVFALAAAGVLLLVIVPSTPAAFTGAALVALALGAEADILTFLISRYFSLREFSRVVGIVWVAWAWGGGVGTMIMSGSYMLIGSYTPAYLFFALIVSLAAVQVCFIGPYRYPVLHRKRAEAPLSPA